MADKAIIVIGAGDALGGAIARRFAKEGYAVALLARRTELTQKVASAMPGARAYACDGFSRVAKQRDVRAFLRAREKFRIRVVAFRTRQCQIKSQTIRGVEP